MAKTLKGRLGRLVVICAGATALHAQVGGGTFTGEVRDTSGAVVPAAIISITSVATGVVTTYKTSNEGVYFSPALIPGNYTISAEKEVFKKQIFGPVRVDVAQTVRVDLVLAVGALNQTMEVKATGAQVLQTESGDISQVIGSQAISQLPLNGRSYLQLAYSNSSVTPLHPRRREAKIYFTFRDSEPQATCLSSMASQPRHRSRAGEILSRCPSRPCRSSRCR